MMMRFKALALAAAPVAALAVLAPQAPLAAQAASPLTQVTAHLKAVNTMVAGFRQTDRKGRTLTGTMTLKRPGKLRFEYQKGVPMLIVADGRKLNMIDYETGRVDGWPIGNSPLGILLNPNPDLSRIAKVVRNDAQTLLVQARDPRKPEFGTITLGFAKVSSALPGFCSRAGRWSTPRTTGRRSSFPASASTCRWRTAPSPSSARRRAGRARNSLYRTSPPVRAEPVEALPFALEERERPFDKLRASGRARAVVNRFDPTARRRGGSGPSLRSFPLAGKRRR